MRNVNNAPLSPLKRCSKCRTLKDCAAFAKNSNMSDGLQKWCKTCWQEYNQTHKDEVKEYNNSWRTENREQKRLSNKMWADQSGYYQIRYINHREYYLSQGQTRRGRILGVPGRITPEIVVRLYEESEDHCGYCGIRLFGKFHVDHIQPISREGSNLEENLCISCSSCNLSKGSKILPEWVETRGW